MLTTAIKLALVTTVLALVATGADAQRVHPKCTKAKDRVKCTCWVESGGYIWRVPGAERPRAAIDSMEDVDRYIAFMRRNGRPNG